MAQDGISFEEFCRIIDQHSGHSGERKGLIDVYNVHMKVRGVVIREDANLVASIIIALDPVNEW